MHASRYLPVAAFVLGTATAIPAATNVPRAEVADPTAPWITVADDGIPSTVTPKPTVISGTQAFADGAPNELTGSVFTFTLFPALSIVTSTGAPPLATALARSGRGAFVPCKNKDGENKPFCDPAPGSELFVDTTYYVTWDPSFFISGNQTNRDIQVRIKGQRINGTSIGDVVFTAEKTVPAKYGYYAWTVGGDLINVGQTNANIGLLLQHTINGEAKPDITGPRLTISYRPQFHPEGAKMPTGPALYIGLPTVGAFIIICVIGGCIWNRRHRKIGLGNVMSRSRHGYGIGKARAQRLGARVRKSMMRKKDQGIMLRERDMGAEPGYEYRDVPEPRAEGMPRRDSDALGSLAGSPTRDRFHGQEAQDVRGGNAFRDEMRRQERERY